MIFSSDIGVHAIFTKKMIKSLNNADNTEITCISLCSGYEGLGLGLKRVIPNLRVVLYSEIEIYACEVLVELMEAGENRVDRLRLLGNGVVPQTAEKAFLVLWEKLKKPQDIQQNFEDYL